MTRFLYQASFGDKLNPNILMEWFEVQRLLGVDKIQLMDLHNPEPIQKVFRYYTDLGLLDLLPYELPGEPAPPFIYPYPLVAMSVVTVTPHTGVSS